MNKHQTVYKCEKCDKTFKHRGIYMIHLQRKRPCGVVPDSYILQEAKNHIQNALADHENIPKIKKNIPQLKNVYNRINKYLSVIYRLEESTDEQKQSDFSLLQKIKDDIAKLNC